MKKEMIQFHIKLLIFQIVIYGLFYLLGISDGVTKDGQVFIPKMVIFFFSVSVLITVIIPLYKLFKNERTIYTL